MTEFREDIHGVRLFCRFGHSSDLVDLVRNRLPRFTSFVEQTATQNEITVLWTDQPGGYVSERKFALDAAHCADLAKAVSEQQEFEFLAWTPWRGSRVTPAVKFVRNQLGGDGAVITLSFPPHRFCEGVDYKKEIDYLVGLNLHTNIGFEVVIAIRIGNEKGPVAFKSINMYYYTCNGLVPMQGVQDRRNSSLPEGEYVDPDTLFERVKRGEIT